MTKTKHAVFTLTSLAVLLATGIVPNAFAAEPFICDSFVESQTINSEVIVPEGETFV